MPDARSTTVPAPLRGEHGHDILAGAGFEDATIKQLVEDGVVWIP